jgi:hypothetical protein
MLRNNLKWLGVFAALLLLAGCDNPIESPPTPPPHTTPKAPPPRVELMPESSPEAVRRHIFDTSGREISLEIQYRNGDKETQSLRTDGTLASKKLVNGKGDVKSDWQYSPNGKWVVSGFEKRNDGSLLTEVKADGNGNYVTTVYWWNKAPFSVEVRKPDGSFETTWYWRTGVVAGKRSGTAGGVLSYEELNNWQGQKVLRREPLANGTDYYVIVTRPDGTMKYRWVAYTMKTSWGSTRTAVKYVEAFDAAGKNVVSRVTMDSNGWSVAEVAIAQSDGTWKVSVMRPGYNAGVDREEIRSNPTAPATSTKTFGAGEKAAVPYYDTSSTSLPSQKDPTEAWRQEEDSTYYRTYSW